MKYCLLIDQSEESVLPSSSKSGSGSIGVIFFTSFSQVPPSVAAILLFLYLGALHSYVCPLFLPKLLCGIVTQGATFFINRVNCGNMFC